MFRMKKIGNVVLAAIMTLNLAMPIVEATTVDTPEEVLNTEVNDQTGDEDQSLTTEPTGEEQEGREIENEELPEKLVEPLEIEQEDFIEYVANPMMLTDAETNLPRDLDGSKVETSVIQWITEDSVEDGDNNVLNQKWEDDNAKSIRFRYNFALSGQHNYPAGTVTIKIPKAIVKDREGNYTGKMTLAVPEAPDKTGLFYYTETDEYYVLTNTKELNAATSGMVEGTIKELVPHTIKDTSTGYKTENLDAIINVVTHQGNQIEKKSNKIKAHFDTQAKISSAVKKGLLVRESWSEDWPSELKPKNHEDYVYADWNVYAYSKANQTYKVSVKDTIVSNGETGETHILGYTDTRTGKTYKGNGTGNFEQEVYKGYLSDGYNYYGRVYTAFPKSDFKAGEVYELKNTVTYTLTSDDDKEVTTTSDDAVLKYSPVVFKKPKGHFIVHKEGWGSDYIFKSYKVEGVYSYALNKLRDGKDVELEYHVKPVGFGMPWTVEKGADETDITNYGKVPYKMVVRDYLTNFNHGKEMGEKDFKFTSLKINRPNIYSYNKYEKDGYGYYESEGVVKYGLIAQGQYGYKKIDDYKKVPNMTVIGVRQDGSKVEQGVVSFTTGKTEITAKNGASVKGDSLVFVDGIVDYIVETETTLAAINWDMYPKMLLKATPKHKQEVEALYEESDTPHTVADNEVDLNVVTYGDEKLYINSDAGRDNLYGFAYGAKLEKSLTYENNPSTRSVDLHYKAELDIQTNISNTKELNEVIKSGVYKEHTSGTYYDLLPKGVVPDLNSIEVRQGDQVTNIEVINNYKKSGRDLLKVDVKIKPQYRYKPSSYSVTGLGGLVDKPYLKFDANYSWESVYDYGVVLNNKIVFESGNDKLGTIKGLVGEPDDPTAGNHRYSKNAVGDLADVLTDLNPNNNNPSFLYAQAENKLDVDKYALTAISKFVDVNKEGMYGDGLGNDVPKNVYEGGVYDYRIRVQSSAISTTKNIVIYDNLENYKPTKDKDNEGDTTWRGVFQGIDLSHFEAKGVKPVVYYSTKKGLVLDNTDNRAHNNLSDTSIWTTKKPSDPKSITAIAIDARTKEDGSPFVLDASDSMNAYINMRAPMAESPEWYDKKLGSGEKEAGLTGGAHAYNNISMISTTTNKESGTNSDNLLVRHDYVKVGLKPYTIKVTKEWDDGDNRDGIRSETVTMRLYANGKDTKKFVTLSSENGWEDEFTKLPFQDENGKKIYYTIKEDKVDGYDFVLGKPVETESARVYNTKNIHAPEKIDFAGHKVWKNDTGATRPDTIKVTLLKNGERYLTKTIKADKLGSWLYVFNNLYKYENGKEIEYKVIEENYVPGYIPKSEGKNLVNDYNPYGTLTFSKDILDATPQAKDAEFKFKLSFYNPTTSEYDLTEYKYTTSDGRKGKTSTGGLITLKGGQSVTIENVRSELKYSIKEENTDGYTNETKESDLQGIIRAGSHDKVKVVNRYRTEGQAVLKANKELLNSKMKPFQFIFDVKNEQGEVLRVASNDIEGLVTFGSIKYTNSDVGKTYTYTITERDLGQKGIVYDKKEQKVKVYVKDDGKGNIVPQVEYVGLTDGEIPTYKNQYKAEGQVELTAYKKIKGNFTPKSGEYEFEVYDTQTKKVVATGVTDDKGKITFTPIKYNETDIGKTYTYRAREKDLGDPDTVYDKTEVEYKVVVYDKEDGTLTFDVQVKDLNTKDINNDSKSPIFVNEKKSGTLKITKYISDSDPQQTFKFKVKLKGDESLIPSGTLDIKREEVKSN